MDLLPVLLLMLVASMGMVLLVGSDMGACIGIFLIIGGAVMLGVQTGPATGMSGAQSGVNTAVISKTIVDADSDTRWRKKSEADYDIGFFLAIAGVVLLLISVIAYLAQ